MQIVYVTPEFPSEDYYSGGLANYLLRTGMALTERGHDIHMVVQSSRLGKTVFKGITLHRIPARPVFSKFLPRRLKKPFQLTFDHIEFAWSTYRYLLKLYRARPYDIVQFSNYKSCGLFATILPFPVPVVTRISSFRPAWNILSGVTLSKDILMTQRLEQLQLKRSKNLFCPSSTIRDMTQKAYQTREIALIRTPFFPEVEETDSSLYDRLLNGKKYVLFIGRLQLHKGIRVLIDALPAFLNESKDAHVVFAGIDGFIPGLDMTMEQYAYARKGINRERLLFLGQVSHPQLYPIIQGAKIITLPSLIDNLPNSLLESMAFGRPVIGTMGASFDEIISDNVNGFLVPVSDPAALADKMIEAWKHPDLDRIGEAARQKISKSSSDIIINQLVNYYQNAKK